MKLTDTGNIYFPDENGNWVSDNQRRVAEIIQDYDPTLQLQWIPPNDRGDQDYAFRVVAFPPGKPAYAVCFSHEADERLLARIFAGDETRNGGILNVLDRMNAAQEALNLKKELDEQHENHNLAMSILKSTKIQYKHNGIDFSKPFGGRFDNW